MTTTGEIYKKDWWQIEAFRRFVPTIKNYINTSEIHHILDLGSGNGVVTQYIASIFPNADVFGVDANKEMVFYAKENNIKSNIKFEHLDIRNIEKLYEKNIKFDLVNANYVLHWVSQDEKKELFQKLSKIITPNAFLMLGTCQRFPNFLKFLDKNIRKYLKIQTNIPDYVHYFSEKGWADFLHQNNFSVKGSYKNLDTHPILLSEKIDDPNNFLRIWLYGASAGKAAYSQPPEYFNEKFIQKLIKKTCELYGTENYYKNNKETENLQTYKYAVFEEETLFMIAQRA
jgi:SAM-dependent methyltransferase